MTTVPLKGRSLGRTGGPDVIVLHGMLGGGRNWLSMARRLEDRFRIHILDARNHGGSPHASSMDYPSMAADTLAWMDAAGVKAGLLIGHSMGGKTAMRVAMQAPGRVRGLVVVDIAPKDYAPRWEREFQALRGLPVVELSSRAEAEALLEPAVPDWAFRQFLLSNLERRPEGGFRWIVNLEVIHASLPELFRRGFEPDEQYAGPTLFLTGERSRFVSPADHEGILRHFPAALIETVPGAGHNIHMERPELFVGRLVHWMEASGLAQS